MQNLKTYYPIKSGIFKPTQYVKAVDDISFTIKKGQTFGLVGESGCGKSTLGKSIVRLEDITSGEIKINGVNITQLNGEKLREARKNFQMIFQDPYASLNPMQMVGDIIGEPLQNYHIVDKKKLKDEVMYLLNCVGMSEDTFYKYAHQFSGGQRQRIGIARAFAIRHRRIVADVPISTRDVSVQTQVLNLLNALQKKFHLIYLFIAHDLGVIKPISDVIGVMHLGPMVEITNSEELYKNHKHPYTNAFISYMP
ncbi:ATP-binding cassette domain-containing protein, partial [Staphylococcus haemolyticus]|uniref:ATP-binding cassette domain-containing protein n=1 Tax=Staphylococcus haemolyticus TaxID=1283 RepID=UPI00214DE4D5